MIIRDEQPADVGPIHSLTERAFRTAAHTSHTEQFIVAALRREGALSASLVAEEAGVLQGHVALSPVILSDGTRGWFGLGPLSVLPEWQRRGIGSALMEAALQRLRERGAAGCVLLGDPGYYARFGFRPAPGLVLPDVPPEYFQALVLRGAAPIATVRYHAAFEERGGG